MAEGDEQPFSDLEATLKKAAAALRDANVPFLLGGSLASWARGEELSVLGMEMQVMALEDVIVTKLRALTEHHLRYESLLAIARALREKIDWAQVRRRTQDSPYARAFFVLLEGLDIIEPQSLTSNPGRGVNVRVLTPGHEQDTGRFDADAG